MCNPRTGCTAAIGDGRTPPFVCGRIAAGPHPDPDKGYLLPLCKWHLDELAPRSTTPEDAE